MPEARPNLSMSPEAVAEEMRLVLGDSSITASSWSYDPEKTHRDADALMVRVLRTLGYTEAMDVYESMTRWYA